MKRKIYSDLGELNRQFLLSRNYGVVPN